MLHEFARRYRKEIGSQFDAKRCHIRCLAHIINLTTQALISKRSQSKFYDPEAPDDHIPDVTARNRDEVGMVRAICVKGCALSVIRRRPYTVR
ncbi:hypothetical protein M378DRAFT_19479 [Amanita muscaria Koide BX008]|uniref:Uncharacterized protein n=1 Tax=Amanita muscaria (strain Koide BX008) TaxID=946122 RepID=A0A0C2WB85_AMAMK|nr:hypothetical protein M378DRAFT_19479 [Amanita muscaria Koide BX008]